MFFKKIISTKISILIIVICSLLAGGILAWQYFEVQKYEVPPIKFPPKPEQQVTITTDKTEYEQGEVVKLSVKNNLDESICFESCNTYFFQKKNWTWKEYFIKRCEVSFITECINSLEIKEFKDEFPKVDFEKGTYRIAVPVYIGCQNEEYPCEKNETIYSNEFTIKEKSAADPRCSQKVKITGVCEGKLVDDIGYQFNSEIGKCIEKVLGGNGCRVETPFNSLEECQKVCEISIGKELPFTAIRGFAITQREERNYVIKNEAEWVKILTKTDSELPVPVDFTKEMIIAVFQGATLTGGYSIEITKITENKDNIVVFVREISPGPNCMVTQATGNPYHIVKVKKSDKEVVFKTEKVITNCQ